MSSTTDDLLRDLTPEAAATLSPAQLELVEDALRLDVELNWEIASWYAGPRLMLLALTFIVFLLLQGIAAELLPWVKLGPVGIPAYLAIFAAAIFGTRAAWRHAGMTVRQTVRAMLHYWPLLLYLFALLKTARA